MARYIVFAYEEGFSCGGCFDIVFSFGTYDEYQDAYDAFDDVLASSNFTNFQVYDTKVRDMIFSDKKADQYDDVEGRVLEYLGNLSLTLSF